VKAVLLVDVERVGEDEVELGILGERASNRGQGILGEHVIGIEPSEDVSLGSAKSVVDRVCWATIWLGDPVVELVCILAEEVNGAIRGAAVVNANFQIRIALIEETIQGLAKE
jgi:hypothetical protein